MRILSLVRATLLPPPVNLSSASHGLLMTLRDTGCMSGNVPLRGVESDTTEGGVVRRIVVGITAALFFMSLGPAALAEERVCRGSIGARTVDNLRVPQGATCTLNGTFVKGTIKVERAATLWAHGVRVIGNVQAENSRNVLVNQVSRIGGSVQIVQGGAARIVGNRITGDVLFDDQDRLLVANRNRIGGNLQAFQNNGGIRINNNRIDGNLQCKENVPAPTGGGNQVGGNKEDQCEGL